MASVQSYRLLEHCCSLFSILCSLLSSDLCLKGEASVAPHAACLTAVKKKPYIFNMSFSIMADELLIQP